MTYSKHNYKGKFVPTNPQKYVGNVHQIIYRSSYELKFMKWLDHHSDVLNWNSEEMVVPYISPVDNCTHRYFVDFLMKMRTASGQIKVYLIEVKPFKFTQEPTIPSRRSKRFLAEVTQWGINQAKWNAALVFCKSKGWEFMIVTERDLGIRG